MRRGTPSGARSSRRVPELWDEAYLRRRYVTDEASADTIAVEVGCTRGGVLQALRRHGVPVRAGGVVPRLASVSADDLLALARRETSVAGLADVLSVSVSTLRHHVARVGLTVGVLRGVMRRTPSRSDLRRDERRRAAERRDRERADLSRVVVERYRDGATIGEVGAIVGRDPSWVFRVLRGAGVDTGRRRAT